MGSEGQREARGRPDYLLYVVFAARVFLFRCYARNAETDLSADEKKNCGKSLPI